MITVDFQKAKSKIIDVKRIKTKRKCNYERKYMRTSIYPVLIFLLC